VGIIANPASGKDIRRLVAYGSVFDNNEKANIVKRLIMAMDSIEVEEVVFMPDYWRIGLRALDGLDVSLKVSFLDMKMEGSQEDSVRAAEIMNAMGVACIITLGGDGTNRVVAKTCGHTPLMPISTGTNNVFPYMVEGTMAGLAAGVMAMNSLSLEQVTRRAPRLEVRRGSDLVDIALIDMVVSDAGFTATRAIWDVSSLHEIFLTRSEPGNIGFSAVGGQLCPIPPHCGRGLHIIVGRGQKRVKTPIAPGLICWLPIESHHIFRHGEAIPVSRTPSMIALDGEREISVRKGDRLNVSINPKGGPVVVDIDQVLKRACEKSLFLSDQL